MKIGLKTFTEDAFKKLQKFCLKKHNIADVRACQSFHKKVKVIFKGKKRCKTGVYFVSKEGYALQLCCLWSQV